MRLELVSKGRLCLLVESESLLNDGAAAVLFVMALAWAQSAGHAQASVETVTTLLRIVLGGVIIGAVFGGVVVPIAKRTSEHLIEAALTTVAACTVRFWPPNTLMCQVCWRLLPPGSTIGNLDLLSADEKGYLSLKGREFVISFWEFAAFLANSVVFLLIGIDVAAMPFESYGVWVLLASVALVLLGRGLVVYPLSLLFLRSRWAISFVNSTSSGGAGLRGALALALALSLPPTLPLRHEIVVVTFGVVAFSIVVQGLTMPFLLRRLGYLPK